MPSRIHKHDARPSRDSKKLEAQMPARAIQTLLLFYVGGTVCEVDADGVLLEVALGAVKVALSAAVTSGLPSAPSRVMVTGPEASADELASASMIDHRWRCRSR
jgi:hypothetical protein